MLEGRSAGYDRIAATTGNRNSHTTVFLIALAAYFFLHLLIRIKLTGSLERDEAEIVYLTQHLRLGYGSQPPLYAWLQWLGFSVFGLNRFSLALIKDLMLFITYAGMFRMARPLVGTQAAITASLSLVLFPQIGWESMRDLTHSALLTTLACSTLWCYFAVLRKPDALRYAIFGVLAGLGMLAKYNFAIFLSGLFCASFLVREHREVLWNRKAVISFAVAAIVLLPHALWLVENLHAATAGTMQKMAEGTQNNGYLHNVATGLFSLLVAVLAFTALLLVVYALASRRQWRSLSIDLQKPESRFFICLYGSFLVLLISLVLTGKVGYIKDRWMQPLLFSVPMAAFILFPSLQDQAFLRRVGRIAVIAGMAVLVLIPLRVYVGPLIGKVSPPHHPYPELARELALRFPNADKVVTEGTLLAGNLHFENPALHTMLLNEALNDKTPLQGDILLVMPDDAKPGWLNRFQAAYPQAEIRQQNRLSLDYRFGGKGKMSFDYVYINLKKP